MAHWYWYIGRVWKAWLNGCSRHVLCAVWRKSGSRLYWLWMAVKAYLMCSFTEVYVTGCHLRVSRKFSGWHCTSRAGLISEYSKSDLEGNQSITGVPFKAWDQNLRSCLSGRSVQVSRRSRWTFDAEGARQVITVSQHPMILWSRASLNN